MTDEPCCYQGWISNIRVPINGRCCTCSRQDLCWVSDSDPFRECATRASASVQGGWVPPSHTLVLPVSRSTQSRFSRLPRSINKPSPSIGHILQHQGGHRFLTPFGVRRPVGRRGGTKFHFCQCRAIAARLGDLPIAWDICAAVLQKPAVPSPCPCA